MNHTEFCFLDKIQVRLDIKKDKKVIWNFSLKFQTAYVRHLWAKSFDFFVRVWYLSTEQMFLMQVMQNLCTKYLRKVPRIDMLHQQVRLTHPFFNVFYSHNIEI